MKFKRVISCLLAIVLFAGTIMVTAGAVETNKVTVHYFNQNNWSSPYIYYYEGNKENVAWPGVAMQEEGNGWYSYTINDYTQARVIFSNNGAGQIPQQNQEGYLVSGEKWYANGTWSDTKPQGVTVHYYNSSGWNNPYLYYYNDHQEDVTWPGAAMQRQGNGWYSYTILGCEEVRVIFSDQGEDQNPGQNQEGYLVSGEKWYASGNWYDSKPDSITVHFYNYDNWSNVNIYYYSGALEGTSWTGVPMEADGDGWYTYNIYGYNEVRVLFNNGGNVQIPGQMEPGFLVSEEMWYRNGTWTTQRPQNTVVHFYKPDGWASPKIYYYKNDSDTGKAWPGESMESEGDGWYIYRITKYSDAKVLFNDGTHQIPGVNQTGFDVSGEKWYYNGKWYNSTDTDQDGLIDVLELALGTDPQAVDFDGDNLSDGYEYYTLKTNPLLADTNGNGMNDGDEDFDEDGLNNLQEFSLGTDPFEPDSDFDGLSDYQEATLTNSDPMLADSDFNGVSDADEDFDNDGFNNLQEILFNSNPLLADSDADSLNDLEEYNLQTDPNKMDTDNDGLNDADEIKLGTNPLNPDSNGNGILDGDEIYNVTLNSNDLKTYDPRVVPTLSIALNGTQYSSLRVEMLEEDDALLSSNLQGFIGCAYDFTVNGTFETAQLQFAFDQTLLEDADFEPAIFYFNEDTQLLEKVENQTITGNTVTAQITHFSTYILLNNKDFSQVFQQDIKGPNEDAYAMDIAFVIDSSGSMSQNDPQAIRKTVSKTFIDALSEYDRCAVVDLDSYATLSCGLTVDKTAAKNAINTINSSGGTDIYAGLSCGLDALVPYPETGANLYKAVILLTDGEDSTATYQPLIDKANLRNIEIYTVGLGDAINETQLKKIAADTGGKYYKAAIADDLIGYFEEISQETIDYITDSNNDGISDYFTRLICEDKIKTGAGNRVLRSTVAYSDFQSSDDYDGDGLKNGEEISVVTTEINGKAWHYVKMLSAPDSKDSDTDDIDDWEDATPLKAWRPTTSMGQIVYDAGFVYAESNNKNNKDIIYSRMNAKQRDLGFSYAYDEGMAAILCRLDVEPVYFTYGGKEWMIELWKGQYGIETGAEIGVYNRSAQDTPIGANVIENIKNALIRTLEEKFSIIPDFIFDLLGRLDGCQTLSALTSTLGGIIDFVEDYEYGWFTKALLWLADKDVDWLDDLRSTLIQALTAIKSSLDSKFFECADDSELLNMSFTLEGPAGNVIFTRGAQEHWWSTGFKWGTFTRDPGALTMEITIEFPNSTMRQAFLYGSANGILPITPEINLKDRNNDNNDIWGLVNLGRSYTGTGNTVNFTFDSPLSNQPYAQDAFGSVIQSANKSLTDAYNTLKNVLGVIGNDPNEIEKKLYEKIYAMDQLFYTKVYDHYKTELEKYCGHTFAGTLLPEYQGEVASFLKHIYADLSTSVNSIVNTAFSAAETAIVG